MDTFFVGFRGAVWVLWCLAKFIAKLMVIGLVSVAALGLIAAIIGA